MGKRKGLDIWIREHDMREIRRAARLLGITVNDYIRQMVRGARLAAEAAGEWPRKRGPARYSFPADSLEKVLAKGEPPGGDQRREAATLAPSSAPEVTAQLSVGRV